MLTMNILHTIESAYNRSLRGGERDSLRSARVVTQTEPIGGGYTNQQKENSNYLNLQHGLSFFIKIS